jgi:hypothetical protein
VFICNLLSLYLTGKNAMIVSIRAPSDDVKQGKQRRKQRGCRTGFAAQITLGKIANQKSP